MPMYSVVCEGCGEHSSKKLSFVDYESVKLGVKTLECSACHGHVVIEFDPGDVSFVLKDGESGGFVSKAGRENKYRARRREIMTKRERDHVRPTTLIPNHKGVETGSWREAREEARKETGNLGASTYDSFVKKEGSG